jgi:hypothetical protein
MLNSLFSEGLIISAHFNRNDAGGFFVRSIGGFSARSNLSYSAVYVNVRCMHKNVGSEESALLIS